MGNNRDRTPWFRSDNLFRAVVLGLIFAVGLVFILVGERISGFWSDFLGGIGVAFITTAVLGFVLESHLKERLFTDIKKEVAGTLSSIQAQAIDAVHLSRLPAELLDVVRKTVTESPIIERDITASYQFTSVTFGRKKALRAEITASSIFENLTDQFQSGDIFEGGIALPARLHRTAAAVDDGFATITTEIIQGSTNPAPFTLDKAGMQLFISERNQVPHFQRPIQFSPRCRLRVTISEVAYFGIDDLDWFTASKPSINMTIIASFPNGAFKLKGSPDDALIDLWEGADEQGRWVVKGGLLPGQGIKFEWEPIEEDQEESPPPRVTPE